MAADADRKLRTPLCNYKWAPTSPCKLVNPAVSGVTLVKPI